MIDLLPLGTVLFTEEPRLYTYRGKAYKSVTDRMKEAGLCETFDHVPEDRMELARTRGTYVHLGCEWLDLGKGVDWSTVDSRLEGYLRAHERFLEEVRPSPIAIEKPMVATKLGGIGVGGRPDAVYFIRGRRAIVDRKSGNGRAPKSGHIQTAGYAAIWNENHPQELIADRFIEKLYPSGKYELVPCSNPIDMIAFVEMLQWCAHNDRLNKWKEYYGK